MKQAIRKTLVAAGATAAFTASFGTMAKSFPDFVVNESSISGASPNIFTADKITGNFVEVISFAGTTSGTFDVALKWNAGQFVANNGATPVASQLGSLSANQYGLYALYQGSGTFNTTSAGTIFNFTPGGSLRVFADPSANTVILQPSSGRDAFTTTGSADDRLIATGMPTPGQGQLDPNCRLAERLASIAVASVRLQHLI